MSRTIIDALSDYFHIGDSYHYVLGRDKAAFGIGTMSFDDFKEYDTDDVAEIAAHLEAVGVSVQQWISVSERMPEKEGDYLIYTTVHFVPDHVDELDHYDAILISGYHPKYGFLGKGGKKAKAWMPLPNPPTE